MNININNLPKISFTYFKFDQIPLLDGILSSTDNELDQLYDHYTLLNHEDHPLFHSCIIYDILYEDLEKSDLGYIKMFYNDFVEKYGQDKVDRNILMNKIYDVITFAFDKIYKTDKIVLDFWKMPEVSKYQSSIPDIIYQVATEHFTIISNNVTGYHTKHYSLIISSILPEYNIEKEVLIK